MSTPPATAHNPPTPAGTHARHRRHANPFTVRGPISVPDWQTVFGRCAPMALDVGCGAGRYVLDLAAAQPAWDVVGLEIRAHLVARVHKQAVLHQLKNAYAILANANVHLPALFAPRSLVAVSFNFPDPWYKKRHHKRRVLCPALLDMLVPLLQPGAHILATTDYAPLAEHMLATLTACSDLRALPLSAGGLLGTVQSERALKHTERKETIYRHLFAYRG